MASIQLARHCSAPMPSPRERFWLFYRVSPLFIIQYAPPHGSRRRLRRATSIASPGCKSSQVTGRAIRQPVSRAQGRGRLAGLTTAGGRQSALGVRKRWWWRPAAQRPGTKASSTVAQRCWRWYIQQCASLLNHYIHRIAAILHTFMMLNVPFDRYQSLRQPRCLARRSAT